MAVYFTATVLCSLFSLSAENVVKIFGSRAHNIQVVLCRLLG